MTNSVTYIVVPKEEWDATKDTLTSIQALLTNLVGEKHALPMVTMTDIQKEYGIPKAKWRTGVAAGRYPKPVEGFASPKRWFRKDVENVVYR